MGGGDDAADVVAEPSVGYRTAEIRSFRDLDVWKDAVALAEVMYGETRLFPDDERFGLTSQLRRASVSIASNVAEGWGRNSRKDYVRFLYVARGSLVEVTTQVEIAGRVALLSSDQADRIQRRRATCGKRLSRLIAPLKRPQSPSPNP